MADIGAEQRFRRVQQAVEKAQDYARHRQYRQAASSLAYAKGLIPKGKRDPFYTAYLSLGSEIKMIASETAEGLGSQFAKSYHTAAEEFRKLTVSGAKKVDGTEAKKSIRYVDGKVSQYVGSDMPAEISRPMRSSAKAVAKLKKELEDIAKKNGTTIDWSKD